MKSPIKPTFANIRPGMNLICSYRSHKWASAFIGFFAIKQGESESIAYPSVAKLCADYIEPWRMIPRGIEGLALIEKEKGLSFYARFRDADGMEWDAYIYQGRWVAGSSADRLSLSAPAIA
jgi:hypothetical protein